jgi:hypothetical protein
LYVDFAPGAWTRRTPPDWAKTTETDHFVLSEVDFCPVGRARRPEIGGNFGKRVAPLVVVSELTGVL